MRLILISAALTAAASMATAQSVDVVRTRGAADSIDFIRCTNCKPLKTEKAEVEALTLKPGTQKIEIRDVDGVRKVFRTEAWMGGSPVTFVSKDEAELMDAANTAIKVKAEPDTASTAADMGATTAANIGDNAAPVVIDHDTTSSTNADMSGNTAPAPEVTVHKTFNPQDLELRVQ